MTAPTVGVVICTRDRPEQAARTLHALARQTDPDFGLVVVVQGDHDAWASAAAQPAELDAGRGRIIYDDGIGVSRARNIGYRSTDADWVVYLDDDCVPADDWMAAWRLAIAAHPEASMISGDVREDEERPEADYVRVSVSQVERERVVRGRFSRPWDAGFGVNFGIAREAIEALGGFDEGLGPGTPVIPAAEDMDLIYRLLRSGRCAYVTPRIRATHEQWRTPVEVIALQRRYAKSWAAMSLKHLRTGDPAGGLWLWPFGVRTLAGMAWSAVRLRSPLRARVAWAIFQGIVAGTFLGMTRRW